MSSALMSIGLRAMFADSAGLQATGHNIANAQVEGYSRQTVELATSQGQYTGAGFFGKGVDVVTVQRASNQFLTMQSQVAKSLSSMDDTRQSQLTQLQNVFPTGDTGLGAAMGNFLNSFVDLANNPSDSSARQVALSDASEVAARFASAGAQLDQLQAGVTSDMKSSAASLNALTGQVASLNDKIAAQRGTGQAPNDLLDQRDQLVKQISGYVKVTTLNAPDGSVGVFMAGGQRLVLGNRAETLTVTPDTDDASRSALSIFDGATPRQLPGSLLAGGSIAGLLRFQNDDLVDARNLVGQMAATFAARVNQVQSYGVDMGAPPGPGAALFATGAPVVLPSTNNARTSSGTYAAGASVQITDASQLKASDYSLENDPAAAGSFLVTRLSDGAKFDMAPDTAHPGSFLYTRQSDHAALGNSMDGFQIALSGAAPAPGDRFLLQPVGRAANSMARALDDPNGIAAAAPMTATTGVANTGTATVASLDVVSAANNPALSADISFTNGSGAYSWQLLDRATGTVSSSGTGTWTAGQPISINGLALALNGVPANGDTLAIDPTQHPANNNGNAKAFSALADEPFIGRTKNPDGSLSDGATATDAYASAIADIGVRVQSAKTSARISAAASAQADQTVSASSGVNIDEEAARLIQFQQGYQAAAKVLQVAQSVFQTMLQVAGAS